MKKQKPISQILSQFKKPLSYVIVGGGATVVEWGFYYFFSNILSIQYLISTVLAIIISTFSNWAFGRLLTFRNAEKQPVLKEIAKIYAISIVGLLMNMFLMWLLHGQLGLWDMAAKVIATGIVFVYNYLIRVLAVYRK
ncbi:MAG: GtrA family protein [Anaerovoracaceae bacterium]|jgi:putative flippase GtrA